MCMCMCMCIYICSCHPNCTRAHSPWYSPGDPDPAGVKLKILREALKVLTHIAAIFVDYASLFQASGPAR